MITRNTQGGFVWIDLSMPTQEEIREVMEEQKVPPQLMYDLAGPVPRSEAICVHDTIKVTLDFPVVKLQIEEAAHEIKFLITKDALITVRYEDISALHQFAKEFEVSSTLEKGDEKTSGHDLFISIMRTLYISLEQKLDYIDARLTEIEREIFKEHEREMVVEISHISQRIIMFRQSLMAHEQVLAQLRPLLAEVFGTTATKYSLHEIDGIFRNLVRRLTTLSASMGELRETNNSLITTKQNEIMKNLTIMAFITFPLSLFTSMFGMNTSTLPFVGIPGDFWIILGIMLLATIGFFIFFKHKRWM